MDHFKPVPKKNIGCRRFVEKTVLITGSTQGIGFAIARRLAEEGANVVICSRKSQNVKNAVDTLKGEGFEVIGVVCHVGNFEDRARLLNEIALKYGKLDVLVLNAAVNPPVPHFFDCTDSIWDKIFDVNVKSTFLLMKEALPLLRKGKSANIVLMSSVCGYNPSKVLGAYGVSKAALFNLCRASAKALELDGIRVNCIAPGLIDTKFANVLTQSKKSYDTIMTNSIMRRMGKPEEIASVAAFLASDDASYITAETISVAGGVLSRL